MISDQLLKVKEIKKREQTVSNKMTNNSWKTNKKVASLYDNLIHFSFSPYLMKMWGVVLRNELKMTLRVL